MEATPSVYRISNKKVKSASRSGTNHTYRLIGSLRESGTQIHRRNWRSNLKETADPKGGIYFGVSSRQRCLSHS